MDPILRIPVGGAANGPWGNGPFPELVVGEGGDRGSHLDDKEGGPVYWPRVSSKTSGHLKLQFSPSWLELC